MSLSPHGAPVVETERLRLRVPEMRDFEGFAGFLGSERARHVGGPVGRGPAWRAFCHLVGHWTLRGYGPFTIELRPEFGGRAIGHGGPWRPEEAPETEIGYCIWRGADEGRGYAREAVRAARLHAWEAGLMDLVSYIVPGNAASVRVAEALGAWPDPTAHRPGPSDLVYRHPRPDAHREAAA